MNLSTHITIKTAKLLDEVGFHKNIEGWYDRHGTFVREHTAGNQYHERNGISAPTQSQLQQWLRIEHNIYVEVTIDTYREPNTLAVTINKVNDDTTYIEKTVHPWQEIPHYQLGEYDKALEHGLQEALKLIE